MVESPLLQSEELLDIQLRVLKTVQAVVAAKPMLENKKKTF